VFSPTIHGPVFSPTIHGPVFSPTIHGPVLSPTRIVGEELLVITPTILNLFVFYLSD